MTQKKFTFNDLQPRIEMLIDAIENKGSGSSGVSYAPGVSNQATLYKELLDNVRNRKFTLEILADNLQKYRINTLQLAGSNQKYRLTQILNAVDFYMIQEYNNYNGSKE
jgi:hypothetical protein